MGDLFLHLPFARRLRLAEGLHPLASEALVRRPALVALGAALSQLPETDRKGMSFFRRLFSRGGEGARWQKMLAPAQQPRLDLAVALLSRADGHGLGALARLSIGLGFLSHEVLEASIAPVTSSLDGNQRRAVERAQARLWLQSAVPRTRDLELEWRPILELADAETHRRAFEQVDLALRAVHGGQSPGRDALARWVKGLCADLAPLAEKAGLPPESSVTDSAARPQYFDGSAAFVEKAQHALGWFVALANRAAEKFTDAEPDRQALLEALGDGAGHLMVPSTAGVDATRERWRLWLTSARDGALSRGRNPRPAYQDLLDAASAQPANARPAVMPRSSMTQMININDMPPEATGPTGAPPVPAMTQEVSSAQIEAAVSAHLSAAPTAPAMTQEIAAVQIESIIPVLPPLPPPPAPMILAPQPAPPPAGVVPNEVTMPSVVAPPRPPASSAEASDPHKLAPKATQQVSLADIESAVDEATTASTARPTSTEQVSISQIESAVEAATSAEGAALPPPHANGLTPDETTKTTPSSSSEAADPPRE